MYLAHRFPAEAKNSSKQALIYQLLLVNVQDYSFTQ